MHRHTDKPWSHIKNYVSLTYFTGQNRPLNKEGVNDIFKPAEPHRTTYQLQTGSGGVCGYTGGVVIDAQDEICLFNLI